MHLLASGTNSDQWLVDTLRRAAVDARRQGAPDVARVDPPRAILEPPAADVRAEVLLELGSVEMDQMPAVAVEHLTAALQMTLDPPNRSAVELALSQALALVGRFTDAAELLETSIAELDNPARHRGSHSAPHCSQHGTSPPDTLTRPLIAGLSHEAAETENEDPRVHANLAIGLCAEGRHSASERSAMLARPSSPFPS